MSKILSLALCAVLALGLLGCGAAGPSRPSDEEIIGSLGEKFMVALYTSDTDTAKEICNSTGYDTFKSLGGAIALATFGMNSEIFDETLLVSKITLLEARKISDTKGYAKILSDLGDKPATYTIPCEKDADGNWKVAVTKQSFN